MGFVPFQSRAGNRATGMELLALVKRIEMQGPHLDSERERGHVETIKHEVVTPYQSGKSILNSVPQRNTAATL